MITILRNFENVTLNGSNLIPVAQVGPCEAVYLEAGTYVASELGQRVVTTGGHYGIVGVNGRTQIAEGFLWWYRGEDYFVPMQGADEYIAFIKEVE